MGRSNPTVSNDITQNVYGSNLRISVAASQGGRKYMEDRCLIRTERRSDGSLKWCFIGVFDGHGGDHASEFVRQNLLNNIIRNSYFESENDDDVLKAIRQGFLKTHDMMHEVHEEWPYTASGYPSTAGTTVSCVFIMNGKLYTGHVGDSAIFLGILTENCVRSLPLTVDHKPESIAERERIFRSGGYTALKSGVHRVVWKRAVNAPNRRDMYESIPFLSVARSLGDLWSYNEKTDTYVVSPDPDVDVYELSDKDFCIVLASDGLTNVLNSEQTVQLVFKEEEYWDGGVNQNHARCLLKHAIEKWKSLRADNITVATVIFDQTPISYKDNEVVKRLGPFSSVDQALTDRPDCMLNVTPNCSVVLRTNRVPIIYNGSKDVNFCNVSYRGPGFRTHEEELMEERKFIEMDENGDVMSVSRELQEEDDFEFDNDCNEELVIPFHEESVVKLHVSGEMKLKTNGSPRKVFETKILMVPSPSAANTSTYEPEEGTDEEEDDVEQKPKRVKAFACRRLRSPNINGTPESKRVTRSCSKGDASNSTPKSEKRTPTRRSKRKISEATPWNGTAPSSSRVLRSRKRCRVEEENTGVTPSICKMNIVENGESRSAPSTPVKAPIEKKASKWSLSKIEAEKSDDGIMRVSEEKADEDDVLVEPPSKIRRIYGFVKRLVGWNFNGK